MSPTGINVDVVCSANSQTYNIARNQSIETQSVVWDTGNAANDGKLHLISDKYTLIIYNADEPVSYVAGAGELEPFSYIFGVYLPQEYQAWPQAAKYVNAGSSNRFSLSLVLLAASVYLFI